MDGDVLDYRQGGSDAPFRVAMLGLRSIDGVQGGVEAHVRHLSAELAKLGTEVTILGRAPYVPRAPAQPDCCAVRTVRLWAPRIPTLEALLHSVIGVFYAAFKRPDILHIHGIGPGLVAPLARLFGLTIVVTHHGADYRREKWGRFATAMLRLGEALAALTAHEMICVSAPARDLLVRAYCRSAYLIPNGVAPPGGESAATLTRFGLCQRKYILSVGRLVPEKRQTDLVHAFRALHARFPEWRLALVGKADHDSAYARGLTALAEATPGVVMCGLQTGPALAQLYRSAAAFVLPSSHEGHPIALLEAMAFGLPVLASNIQPNLALGLPSDCYVPMGDRAALSDRLADMMARADTGAPPPDWGPALRHCDWASIAAATQLVYRAARGSQPSEKSRPKRRILFIINSLAGGGAERVMSTLLRHSQDMADQCDIHLALLDEEGAAYDVPDWITLHRLDCRFGLLTSIRRTWSLVGALRPAVSLSFLTRANIANVIACRAHRRVAVISERVDTSTHLGRGIAGWLKKCLVRVCYARATRIIAVSDGVADDLRRNFGVDPNRLAVIANPVDAPTIRSRAAEKPSVVPPGPFIVASGRLVPNKNFSLLIRAFAASGIRLHLVILGDGPERGSLLALAAALGVAERVHLPGFVTNPFSVIRHARMFVLCSNAEGFPNALVEAMALGIPAIATNCPSGPSEILADCARPSIRTYTEAAYGILVRPDTQEDMVAAMHTLCQPAPNRHYRAVAMARAESYGTLTAKQLYWAHLEEAAAEAFVPA